MNEIWQQIGHLNNYEVSNFGNVRNKTTLYVLKPMKDGGGYPFIQVNRKNHKVHRLVALAFIPNPQNKKCVNHLSGDKTNNNVLNLEWCTHGENLAHAHRTGLKKPQQLGKSGKLHRASIPLLSIKDTSIIEHESRYLCAKYLGVTIGAIHGALRNGNNCKGHKLYSL